MASRRNRGRRPAEEPQTNPQASVHHQRTKGAGWIFLFAQKSEVGKAGFYLLLRSIKPGATAAGGGDVRQHRGEGQARGGAERDGGGGGGGGR